MRRFAKSFTHAFHGVSHALKYERNFRIEVLVGLLVVSMMFAFNIEYHEKLVLIFVVFWVLALELVNTAIERTVDILEPKIHPRAGVIKDTMAAAVLLSAAGALFIGYVIFVPYIVRILF